MSSLNPQYTLDWAAYHKFDQLFYAKYKSGKLTMREYLDLIEVSISHVKWWLGQSPVEWYRFRASYLRRKRLDNLNKLRDVIYNQQWQQKRKIGCFATIISNNTGHSFKIGTPVIVINVFAKTAYVKETSVSQGEEVMLDDLKEDTL
jgi:hypothetical protein